MKNIFEKELYFYSDRLRKLLNDSNRLEDDRKQKVFHSCHTLKGLCLAANLKPYAQELHNLEEALIGNSESEYRENAEKVLKSIDDLIINGTGDAQSIEDFVNKFSKGISNKLEKKVIVKFSDQSGNFIENFGEQSFKRIMIHLILNAIHHGIENPRERNLENKCSTGTIDIKLKKDGENYYLSFSDDGKGFEKSDEKNIFSGRKQGLAIVKKIIAYNNGELDLNSEKGNGTFITCKFPIVSFQASKKVA